jgi:hypothetical protein
MRIKGKRRRYAQKAVTCRDTIVWNPRKVQIVKSIVSTKPARSSTSHYVSSSGRSFLARAHQDHPRACVSDRPLPAAA